MKKPSAATKNSKFSIGLVFDDSLDSTDGVAQYVKTLGAWFSAQGHHVSYLVGETKMKEWRGGKVYSLSKNASVSFNANRLSSPLPANSKKIKALLEKEHFDVLHVQVPYSPLMAQKIINFSNPKTAVIGTFHILPAGKTANWGAKLLKPAYGKSLSRFDGFISVSQPAADFAYSTLGIKSVVLPNVVEAARFQPKNTKKNQPMKIVFLGRLVKRKGVMELLRAFELLTEQLPETRLEIAGKGPLEKKLKRYVQNRKLAKKVTFLGFIAEKDKPRLLESATVACFPATGGETFGIVLIEAMAAGSGPVLGGDNPGYRSVLAPQPQLLVDPVNSEQFAKRLAKLLTNQALNHQIRSWQKAYVKRFDITTVGPKIELQYLKAIANMNQKSHN